MTITTTEMEQWEEIIRERLPVDAIVRCGTFNIREIIFMATRAASKKMCIWRFHHDGSWSKEDAISAMVKEALATIWPEKAAEARHRSVMAALAEMVAVLGPVQANAINNAILANVASHNSDEGRPEKS